MAVELHSNSKPPLSLYILFLYPSFMALVVFQRFLSSLPFSPNPTKYFPRNRFHSSSFSIIVKMKARETTESSAGKNGSAAVVWFKHDLRVDDHPGLVAASRYRTVVPLYVFDHRILSRFSDEMFELVLFAVEDLRKSMKDQGSDLMIRFGNAEKVIGELVKEVVTY